LRSLRHPARRYVVAYALSITTRDCARLLEEDAFRSGEYRTGYLEKLLDEKG